MKKLLIGLGVVAILVIIALVVVFQLTSGIVDVADQFFKAVQSKEFSEAYTYVAEDFRAATSLEQLKTYLEQSALINYQDASWNSREITTSQGKLEGTIKTPDGGSVPVRMTFVKEQGKWKILYIEKTAAGLMAEEETTKTIPPLDELNLMTTNAMHELALAINARDFSSFYAKLSKLWQSQTTADDLYNAFKSFSDQNVDLTVLEGMDPVFDQPPKIDETGMLILEGYYPTHPSVTHFDLKYLYEHPAWKLAGVHVKVK